MNARALIRRALPYLVIGVGGFALAYVIIFVFVLPSKIVPPPRPHYAADTATRLQPIDTTTVAESPAAAAPAPVVVPMAAPAATSTLPVSAPDLVGMALSDARAVLNSYRLSARVQRDTSTYDPPNTVLVQSPVAGTELQPGAAVSLTVSYVPVSRPADSASAARPVIRKPLPPIIPTDADTQHVPRQLPQRDTRHDTASASPV